LPPVETNGTGPQWRDDAPQSLRDVPRRGSTRDGEHAQRPRCTACTTSSNRDGTGRADLEEFLAEIVLKIPLADDPERWEAASPMSWVSADAPPMMVIHGANDSLFPVEQARSFATRLLEVSANPVVFAELPGAQHGFDLFASPRALLSASAVHRFLESVRQASQGSPAG
jgi:acetyl esterase/lipase